jgi:hypothetical protein
MHVPSELEVLYKWIEAKGFYDDICGRRRGYLYPHNQLRQSWSDSKHEGGMEIVFFTDDPKNLDKTLKLLVLRQRSRACRGDQAATLRICVQ